MKKEIFSKKTNEGTSTKRRVINMKGIFNKIKLAIVTVAFLGTSAAGMAALAENPVMAAELTEERVADAKSGYSIPSEITIKKGEKRLIELAVPKGTTDVCNIQWSGTQYWDVYSTGGYGSYWGQPGRCTITGKSVGTGTMYVTVEVLGKKGDPSSYKKTVKLKCKVNVIDTNGKSATKVTVPLQKISLNKSSATLNLGSSMALNVNYSPSNTTDSKKVYWSSSDKWVASVDNGKVIAKKAGTAVITARVGNKTATCKVIVSNTGSKITNPVSKGELYKNVSEAYTFTNQFRTTKSNQWYWNPNNRTKTYTYGLKALRRDTVLENIAKQRAKEQWSQLYVRGKATHDRLNGSNWITAYPKGSNPDGENLAWGHKTCKDVVNGWAETNCKYDGQGHRRAMLSYRAKRVGIACYEKDGKTCWAMCLGR